MRFLTKKMQLNLFKEYTNYVYKTGVSGFDFCVYNGDYYNMSNEKIENSDLIFTQISSKILPELKSLTWSSSCYWFFVLQDNGVYLFHVYNDICIFCKKHSTDFIEMFLKVAENRNKITFKNVNKSK